MADLKAALRRVADDLEREEDRERLAKLETRLEEKVAEKKLTFSEARKALEDMGYELIEEQEEREETETPTPAKGEKTPPKDEPETDEEKTPKPKKLKKKSGQVYDWDVEGGKVIKLDVARVHNGPDEEYEIEPEEAAGE